jgi:hypothetical protein
MFEELELLTLERAQELDAWVCAWYDAAVAENFVRAPYHTDDVIIQRLLAYFRAGLSPAESAEACFGKKH